MQCDELVQNTDFVPTGFDVAGVTPPEKYRVDGVSMKPLFQAPHIPIRDYVYGEMGPARSIKTKRWNYIALRYTQDQIETIESGHPRMKQLMGLSGGVSRARGYPPAFDVNQLYDLRNDPDERRNVASQQRRLSQLDEMKTTLKRELERFDDRPFGEFIPGENAVPGDKQIHLKPVLQMFAASMK